MSNCIQWVTEGEARALVVKEALTWQRTPFHPHGHVKGAGCDCLTIVMDPFSVCGVIVNPEIPDYSGHWHLNRDAPEYYLDGMMKYCEERIGELARPADIIVFHLGRTYSHAALVIQWPTVLHSWNPIGVVLADATNDAGLIRETRRWPPRIFNPFGKLGVV